MTRLIEGPLDPGAVQAAVLGPTRGAVVLFLGTTRDRFDGRTVLRLEYEAYIPLADAELATIEAEVAADWPDAACAIAHRLGVVPVGETSVVIAVAAPHRDAAYAASRYAIEALKARVPIFKHEVYADGSAWKANAPT